MATDSSKARAKLSSLSNALSELEIHLQPLFSQTLPETLLPLEALQQAKLQTLLSYVTYDLIFIYLKSRGKDPKAHPVVGELDRIKQYFAKIDKAENVDIKRSTEIDQGAAERFIKHALSQAQKPVIPSEPDSHPSTEARDRSRVPVKVTPKMQEREQYLQDLKDRAEDGSDDDLDVVGDNGEQEALIQTVDKKGKGKAKGTVDEKPVSRKKGSPGHESLSGNADRAPSSAAEDIAKAKRKRTKSQDGSTLKEKKKRKVKPKKV